MNIKQYNVKGNILMLTPHHKGLPHEGFEYSDTYNFHS